MKTVWQWLNNKKSVIGTIAGSIALWAAAKGWLDQNDLTLVAALVTIWSGVAITHKIVKGGND